MWKPKTENWKSNSNGGTTNQNQNQNQSVQRCFPHGELWVGNIFDTYHLMVLRFYDTYRSTVRYIIGEVDNISRRHRRHWVIYELSSGNKLGQFRADSLGNLALPPPFPPYLCSSSSSLQSGWATYFRETGYLGNLSQHPPTNLPYRVPLSTLYSHPILCLSPSVRCNSIDNRIGSMNE